MDKQTSNSVRSGAARFPDFPAFRGSGIVTGAYAKVTGNYSRVMAITRNGGSSSVRDTMANIIRLQRSTQSLTCKFQRNAPSALSGNGNDPFRHHSWKRCLFTRSHLDSADLIKINSSRCAFNSRRNSRASRLNDAARLSKFFSRGKVRPLAPEIRFRLQRDRRILDATAMWSTSRRPIYFATPVRPAVNHPLSYSPLLVLPSSIAEAQDRSIPQNASQVQRFAVAFSRPQTSHGARYYV